MPYMAIPLSYAAKNESYTSTLQVMNDTFHEYSTDSVKFVLTQARLMGPITCLHDTNGIAGILQSTHCRMN